jgi:hypothetical protein
MSTDALELQVCKQLPSPLMCDICLVHRQKEHKKHELRNVCAGIEFIILYFEEYFSSFFVFCRLSAGRFSDFLSERAQNPGSGKKPQVGKNLT